MTKHKLPTGYLIVGDYSKGQLETLSIGDYGKSRNVKADFLGYTKDINGVPNGPCMPMSEKWVVTLSTQYGCPMKCTFCDVPNIKFKGNATNDDLWNQLGFALGCFPYMRYTERLNIHFARMGEPTFNPAVLEFSEQIGNDRRQFQDCMNLRTEVIHPVLTTCLPRRNSRLDQYLHDWIDMKNDLYNGQAGLQFSINSTCEEQRKKMFNDMTLSLEEFSEMALGFDEPIGRKYCLNFAYSTDFEVDAEKLIELFSPEKFMVKITPIHNNNACKKNGIETVDGYESYAPYKKIEESLKNVGFDVLVFVPSMDEEDGLVTCGNAILGGGELKV